MKKILLIVLLVFSVISFVGCKKCNVEEYKTVEIKIQDITNDIIVKKGSIISNDSIKQLKNLSIRGLYYDEFWQEAYNDEPINDDITIYIDLKNDCCRYSELTEEQTLDQICADYYNQCVTFYDNNYTRSDVIIGKYYGNYNGSYVVQLSFTNSGVGWNVMSEYVVGGVKMLFPSVRIPYVWNKGYFYFLETAYNNGLLTMDDIYSISTILNGN